MWPGVSPVVLERADGPIGALLQQRNDIPIIQADAMELPIASGAFDAVLTIEVAICTTGVDDHNVAYFAEVSRILRRNGLFLFTAFNRHSYFEWLNRLRKGRPSYEDLYYSESTADYRRKLRHAGFDVIGCRGLRWPPFKRGSNSRLVPLAVFFESLLMLRRATRFSPWLCFAARKR